MKKDTMLLLVGAAAIYYFYRKNNPPGLPESIAETDQSLNATAQAIVANEAIPGMSSGPIDY